VDENYQTYLNRAMRLTLPETYRSQVQHIQESPKYRPHPEKGFEAVPFPGYTIVTPPAMDDSQNAALYTSLEYYQKQIAQQLGENLFTPVPPDSFHLTLADLIWDSAYRHANQDPNFESQLQKLIAQIFQQYQSNSEGKLIQFQAIGLMVMTRAIAVCLVPTEEHAYDRLLAFRRAIYQNHDLMGLGIEQQYYFTPHITLGYFGRIPAAETYAQLGDSFVELHQEWLENEPQKFSVHRAELRKFDDMTLYYRESDWATLEF
jgi:2'-5' RNA ligase